MRYHLVIACATLALAGCQTPAGKPSVQQNIAVTCQAIASAEDALALVKDKLTPAQMAVIRHAVTIKAPVCNAAPFPATLTDASYAALTGALADLARIKQEAQP